MEDSKNVFALLIIILLLILLSTRKENKNRFKKGQKLISSHGMIFTITFSGRSLYEIESEDCKRTIMDREILESLVDDGEMLILL